MLYFEENQLKAVRLENPKTRTEAWILFLILGLIWGSSFILIKNGLRAFPPDQAAALRLIIAFAVLIPLLPWSFKKVEKSRIKYIVFSGIVGNLITAFLFSTAQTQIQSSVSGILNSLTPAFTLIVSFSFFGFKVRPNHITGVVVALAGAAILAVISDGGALGEFNSYIWLIVIATVCYAFSLNVIKSFLGTTDARAIGSLGMLSAAPFCLIYLALTIDIPSILRNQNGELFSLASLAALGILSTALGVVLYARLISISTSLFASSVAYLIPVVAVMWGVIDGEKLYPLHFLSMTLIIAGIMIANKTGRQK